MTLVCPACGTTLDRKLLDALGEDILRCSLCRRYSLEGISQWLTSPDIEHLRKLAAQRDDDKARFELFMTSDINHPIWTNLSQ